MQNKWRVTGNCIEAFGAYLRLVVGRFSFHKTGNVYAGPFFRVPPHQFFPFAPWMTVRPRTGPVIDDAPIARPREAPSMTEIIFGFARVGLVDAVAAKNTGVDPAAARGRTVGFQFSETIYLRAVMRPSIAIETKNDTISVRLRIGVPAVDLREHSFHLRLAQFVFRVPPIERAQRLVERIVRCFRLRDQTQRELMHEPRIGPTIARRLNCLLAPLQKSLRVSECAFLFGVTGRREEENFSLDLCGLQLTAFNLG